MQATLAELKAKAEALHDEFTGYNQELMELQQEYRELDHYVKTAPKSTPAADILAAQRDIAHIIAQVSILQSNRDEAARNWQKASIEYTQAQGVVISHQQALARTKEAGAAKRANASPADIALLRRKWKKVLESYGAPETAQAV